MAFAAACVSREEEEEDNEATDDYSSYWESIPDPPTPPPTDGAASSGKPLASQTSASSRAGGGSRPLRLHRSRRDSRALRDVTNAAGDGGGAPTRKAAASAAPSGWASGSGPEPVSNPESNDGGSGKGGTGGGGVGESAGETTGSEEARRGARKRRKSATRELSLARLASAASSEDGGGAAASAEPNEGEGAADEARARDGGRNKVARLVRDYCSLPEGRRAGSHEARAIESLSGYPMPGKVLAVASSDDGGVAREEFFLRARPLVQRMEDRKRRDEVEARTRTGCEARKDGRGGYRYFEVGGGERIDPEEYGRRYAAMLDERRRKRTRKGDPCRNIERPRQKSAHEDETSDASGITEGRGDRDSNDPLSCRRPEIDDMDESVNMEDSAMSLEDSPVPNDSEQCLSPEDSNEDVRPDDNPHVNESSSLQASAAEALRSGRDDETGQMEDNYRSRPLLPAMPATDDPRVLAARGRLWRAMDAALAEYSREILALEAADGDVGNQSQTDLP